MNIAEFCIKNKVITWIFTIVVLFGGLKAYNNLSRLEDPEFTIKIATVITPYPGASAREVEKEVSDVLEQAVQQLGQIDYVESRSTRGLSIVRVTIKDKYDKFTLPQVWDELRRKINDARAKLPPGAGEPVVNDDYGDVYGEFYALTGKGYSTKDLVDTADMLKRDLLAAQDVKKISLYGDNPEVIYIEMRREKMAELGVSRDDIYKALRDKNLPADSGHIALGPEYIPLNPTGEFKSEKQFGDLLVGAHGTDRFIKLKDVAEVKRGYKDPPLAIMRYDGEPAVGLGVSPVLGGNVIKMGDSLNRKLREINQQIPVGIALEPVSLQSDSAKKAVQGFVVNLLEAVAIVILVLLFSMGLRSGLIIGAVLFLTICGTFIFMDMWKVTLERISLGALIIALGMLVDNAIVITDGMKVKMLAGKNALVAANEIVGQTAMPLLGATVVAVTAFAAIGTSQDSTGEYCRSLFQVILMSLMFSWVTAVTVTPLFCEMFLLGKKDKERAGSAAPGDPYGGVFYTAYRKFLCISIKNRWKTVAAMLIMFVLAVYGFGFISKSFFPPSTRPQYFVNFRLSKGTSISATDGSIKKAEKYLMSRPETAHVTTLVGGGEIRFLLTYPTELPDQSYGQIVVNVKDAACIEKIAPSVKKDLEELLPGVIVEFKKFMLGPGDGGKLQLRVSGPDHDQLRALADKVKEVLVKDGNATNVRDDWGNRVKVIRPQVEDSQANKLGVSRPDIAAALLEGYDGKKVGVYRENNKLLDICARPPADERRTVDNLYDLGMWSPVEEKTIFIRQVVSGFSTEFEDDTIWRRDRRPTVTIHADQIKGESSALFAKLKPVIEKAVGADFKTITGRDISEKAVTCETVKICYKNKFPIAGMPGYSFGWDGEAEDSAKANANLGKSLPVFFLMMVVIVFCLFNAVRMPLVIWLTVPFSIIGVTFGLLLFDQPFSFMALLGFLSLSGMIIKTAIVLADEINAQISAGKGPLEAVIDSGVNRLNPVFNAAATTMLGMLPLFQDMFFVPMAVTIVFGLGFATLLVLVAVPVFYAIFFNVPYVPLCEEPRKKATAAK